MWIKNQLQVALQGHDRLHLKKLSESSIRSQCLIAKMNFFYWFYMDMTKIQHHILFLVKGEAVTTPVRTDRSPANWYSWGEPFDYQRKKAQQCVKSAGLTCIHASVLARPSWLHSCVLSSAVYIMINTVIQMNVLHTIQYVMTEKQDLVSRCAELYSPTYMPQDTYTCAVTPSSPVCLVFALVHEQLVYLKHTMRGPLSPCPPSLSQSL